METSGFKSLFIVSSGRKFYLNDVTNPIRTSPDLYSRYNEKSGGREQIPVNHLGIQPSNTGDCYGGIVNYTSMDSFISWGVGAVAPYMEYVQLKLKTRLTEGNEYKFKCKVSHAENTFYSCYDLGALFTSTMMTDISNDSFIDVTPQIVFDLESSWNQEDWIELEGSFLANGGENFITFGNFKHSDESRYTIIDTSIGKDDGIQTISYYYIDDFSLRSNNTIDTYYDSEMRTFYISLRDDVVTKKITLYSIEGKLLLSESFTKEIELQLVDFASGLYIYVIESSEGVIKKGKIIRK